MTRPLGCMWRPPLNTKAVRHQPNSRCTLRIGDSGAAVTDPQLPFHRDPDILGGTLVFVGTRVPVQTLLDYLEAGDPLDEFLADFPSVRREQAVAALEIAKELFEQRVPVA